MEDETIPKHLRRWPGLFELRDGGIVDAPAEDVAVARNYPRFRDKGPVVSGVRLTVMSRRLRYSAGEEARIVHVVEVVEPGREVYVMGPKPVCGEYVNDVLVTPPPPRDPLKPATYNGLTLPSPAVDYNYNITSYAFSRPGIYRIQWRLNRIESNTLVVNVETVNGMNK